MGIPLSEHKSLFDELRKFSGADLEVRGENACGVAIKFMELLRERITDDEAFRRVASAWYKSVRDDDVRKFKRALRRYERKQQEQDDE